MSSIPLINIVAVAHLFCIAALSGCMAAEVVFEYYAMFFNRKLHHSVIRIHYWEESLILALKREIVDLRDQNYSPVAMREFIRDTIANINGIYYVVSINSNLVTNMEGL